MENKQTNIVELDRVSRVYQRDEFQVRALYDVTFSLREGKFIAIMGPSGSGKSTLLNLVAGLDRPSQGKLIVAGEEISAMKERKLALWRARKIGIVFQFYNLIPVLTAFENVELPLLLTQLSRTSRKEHVEAVLRMVGLDDRMQHYPRQLSGGQEQRVAIARALVTDPALVIADEPTGDLDARSANEVLNLLMELNMRYNKTIIMVTHDHRAMRFVEEVVHLDKGLLVGAEPGGRARPTEAEIASLGAS